MENLEKIERESNTNLSQKLVGRSVPTIPAPRSARIIAIEPIAAVS